MNRPPKTPLKIGLVCDWYLPRIGGIELHLHNLSLQLAKHGYQIGVITPFPGCDRLDAVRICRINTPLFPFFRFVWTGNAFQQLKLHLRKEQYDVIHCHFSYISPFASAGAYLCQQMKIPAVITFHSFLGNLAAILAGINRWIKWSKWPIVFSAVSPEVAMNVRSLGLEKPVYVLPNGLTPADWACPAASRDPNTVQIVSVMRLCYRKRPHALIKIIAGVIDQVPEHVHLKVKIIGEGYEHRYLKWLIRRFKLEDIVELLGFQPPSVIRDIFSRSDIFVLPAVLESFGISAIEARCAGLPVIAMKHGGVKSFIRNGREGFLVSTDGEMRQRLVQLVCNAELRSEMARYNRKNPPSISWDNVVAQHVQLYREALALLSTAPPDAYSDTKPRPDPI